MKATTFGKETINVWKNNAELQFKNSMHHKYMNG